jgi:hypothetical protein
MKRILLHLAISVLAFGLGITVSALWRSYSSVDLPERYIAYIPSRVTRLELITIGRGSDSTTYLSNGGRITRTCQIFTSAEEANEALQARRHASANVIEWSDIADRNDQSIGQTILILENPTVIRLSTHEETLCETRASSMNEMRWFDNRELR